MINSEFWRTRRVFITGHTGFKGAWLTLWLNQLGARSAGYALAPERSRDIFVAAGVDDLIDHAIGDIRDLDGLVSALAHAEPEIVFHLAAQPLVRRSYAEPVLTYETNVMGTVNLLEACRRVGTVRAVVIATTDKVYENLSTDHAYSETDRLGGYDPYASSKAASELVITAYRRSFFSGSGSTAVASARAGNVIGGGDWNEDRLVPDAMRAWFKDQSMTVRNPDATRPWQHVIEPLRGYLMLAEALVDDPDSHVGAWNFGPEDKDVWPVGEVIDALAKAWKAGDGVATWQHEAPANAPHEAALLRLNVRKARERLQWQPVIPLERALKLTVDWYRAQHDGADAEALRTLTIEQIEEVTAPRRP